MRRQTSQRCGLVFFFLTWGFNVCTDSAVVEIVKSSNSSKRKTLAKPAECKKIAKLSLTYTFPNTGCYTRSVILNLEPADKILKCVQYIRAFLLSLGVEQSATKSGKILVKQLRLEYYITEPIELCFGRRDHAIFVFSIVNIFCSSHLITRLKQ